MKMQKYKFIKNNKPEIFVYDKKRNKITLKIILIEIGISNLELLTQNLGSIVY